MNEQERNPVTTFTTLGYCPGCGYGTAGKHRRNGYEKCPNDNAQDNAAAKVAAENWAMGITSGDGPGETLPRLLPALAGQDHHDAYHVHGMRDAAGCLLCFDYDERHGQYHPETGEDVDGPGCRDCDYPPNGGGWHRWNCPAVAGKAAAAPSPAPQSPDTPSDGVQVGDRFVHLVPAAYELQCSCGHQRENVQLTDFQTGPGGVYLWDCPSCGWRIEFDGADVHIS
jgi:hypothetical protein